MVQNKCSIKRNALMQVQVKQLYFSGQNIYCGLDHKHQVTVVVMYPRGGGRI